MKTWAITGDELAWMAGSAFVVICAVLAWATSYGYPSSTFRVDGKWVLADSAKFLELERDRVLASASRSAPPSPSCCGASASAVHRSARPL